jgi:hypothetical protein
MYQHALRLSCILALPFLASCSFSFDPTNPVLRSAGQVSSAINNVAGATEGVYVSEATCAKHNVYGNCIVYGTQ